MRLARWRERPVGCGVADPPLLHALLDQPQREELDLYGLERVLLNVGPGDPLASFSTSALSLRAMASSSLESRRRKPLSSDSSIINGASIAKSSSHVKSCVVRIARVGVSNENP